MTSSKTPLAESLDVFVKSLTVWLCKYVPNGKVFAKITDIHIKLIETKSIGHPCESSNISSQNEE